jgi:hypothetical protein
VSRHRERRRAINLHDFDLALEFLSPALQKTGHE